MKRRLAACVIVFVAVATFKAQVQNPQPPTGGVRPGPAGPTRSDSAVKPAPPTGRIAGRVVAGDTGKPLRRASVTLMAQPSKMVRIALTDGDGRYEFSGVPAGRYGVTPSKDGYVFVSENPFAGGRGVEIAEGEAVSGTDFTLTRGSVISGRITDEFGEPVAGVTVQAARYQFRPSGQRQLMMGSSGNYFMPAATNDRGEFRIFGLRPGSYYVSARPDTSDAITISPGGGTGISDVESSNGLTTTYYPGTANLAEAQIVRVELMREAGISFALVPARMARISGTVRDSQGQPMSAARVTLRSQTGIVGGWFGDTASALSQSGNFTLANVAPGEYLLDVRPNVSAAAAGGQPTKNEFATVPLTATGEDLDLAITTTAGISVSGRVIFEGNSRTATQNLRISAVLEEDARNTVSYFGGDGGLVDEEGRFHIPSTFGRVLFRTNPLPVDVMLKAVILNGVDITNTPFDAMTSDDVADLQIVLVDKQARISSYARNAQGEIQYNYRLVVYPTHLKDGDVTVRFQHNASPNVKGQVNIGRMPPGEYVGLAVKGVQPGEEWDPELRKRIETFGKRFTLQEGETLESDFPYVE